MIIIIIYELSAEAYYHSLTTSRLFSFAQLRMTLQKTLYHIRKLADNNRKMIIMYSVESHDLQSRARNALTSLKSESISVCLPTSGLKNLKHQKNFLITPRMYVFIMLYLQKISCKKCDGFVKLGRSISKNGEAYKSHHASIPVVILYSKILE